ncbi:hypothetical protein SAMN05444851_0848 [Aliiroseovarius sediminilitoris]|uniref:DUF1223 domain-containing protein n=1 Tax=Aliiroseovarius sediminilitoris TaxID=1173584 RepID=A0A1I0NIE0_9RHOB|nr:DUF1223 domain-containing protein [Aliiroseovarius sediminilitoris]SEW01071.1 hypothetical protein SAMN05444851_0848 [Aliiroseovarius sediminilitoris]
MRAVLPLILICAAWFGASTATAQQRPVTVVELFTSQGCSSCPPADALLGKLAEYDDILPLALHVDYWDYIGWKDTFANAANTKRQKAYAYGFGTRSIYTPQMVIGGIDQVVGSHAVKVMDLIHRQQAKPQRVVLLTTRVGNGGQRLRIERMTHLGLPAQMLVQIVRFLPRAQVDISRGENAGLSITSTNVVTDIQSVGVWDGMEAVEFELPSPIAPDGQASAIILQAARKGGYPGEILAAIKVE